MLLRFAGIWICGSSLAASQTKGKVWIAQAEPRALGGFSESVWFNVDHNTASSMKRVLESRNYFASSGIWVTSLMGVP